MADNERPLNAEQEIIDALQHAVQRVIDFDTRIVSIKLKAAMKRGERMNVEIEVGRTQEH